MVASQVKCYSHSTLRDLVYKANFIFGKSNIPVCTFAASQERQRGERVGVKDLEGRITRRNAVKSYLSRSQSHFKNTIISVVSIAMSFLQNLLHRPPSLLYSIQVRATCIYYSLSLFALTTLGTTQYLYYYFLDLILMNVYHKHTIQLTFITSSIFICF